MSCKFVEVHNADDDVQKLTSLMTEISRSVETQPETALLKLSQELGKLCTLTCYLTAPSKATLYRMAAL